MITDNPEITKAQIIEWINFALGFINDGEPEVAASYLQNIKKIIHHG